MTKTTTQITGTQFNYYHVCHPPEAPSLRGIKEKGRCETMPRRYVKFVQGHFYHIYNRGKDKEKIFYESDNYLYLLKLLKKNAEKFTIAVIAYCLMPNHYHFLLRVDSDGDLSRCVSTTWNSYVQAFVDIFTGIL